jgi:hypothetical protein
MASFSPRHLIHGQTFYKTSYSETPSHISQKKNYHGKLDTPSGVFAVNFEGEFEKMPFSYPIKCGCVRRRSQFNCLLTHFAQRIFLVHRTALEF